MHILHAGNGHGLEDDLGPPRGFWFWCGDSPPRRPARRIVHFLPFSDSDLGPPFPPAAVLAVLAEPQTLPSLPSGQSAPAFAPIRSRSILYIQTRCRERRGISDSLLGGVRVWALKCASEQGPIAAGGGKMDRLAIVPGDGPAVSTSRAASNAARPRRCAVLKTLCTAAPDSAAPRIGRSLGGLAPRGFCLVSPPVPAARLHRQSVI